MNMHTRLLLLQDALRKTALAVALSVLADFAGADPLHNLLRKVATPPSDPFANAAIIDEAELDQLRGGFVFRGIDMNFGASIDTIVNGTSYRMEMVIHPDSVETLSHELSLSPGATEVSPSGTTVRDVAPAHFDLAGLEQFSGIAINDASGFTAALHRITHDAIFSTVISDASNQRIQQKLNIGIRLNNMSAIQAAQQRARIINSLVP